MSKTFQALFIDCIEDTDEFNIYETPTVIEYKGTQGFALYEWNKEASTTYIVPHKELSKHLDDNENVILCDPGDIDDDTVIAYLKNAIVERQCPYFLTW